MPKMKFTEAIRDAFDVTMEAHPEVFLLGVGLIDPKAVFDTIKGLHQKYGNNRVVEGPLAEQMLTGMAFGAATLGLRPVLIHHRIDFVPLTLDQIVNHAAKWSYMFGNQQRVPMVVRGVVGRGWGNGPQHTQSLHGLLSNVPGVKVVVPSNPADAKGLMISAILDNDPVIYIDHRWLHQDEAEVPEGMFCEPLGKVRKVREGEDVTVVAVGPMVQEALIAAKTLAEAGISVEVLDLRTLRPIDFDSIIASVEKTGHLVVTDSDWPYGGIPSTIVAEVSKRAFGALRAAPATVTWPDHAIPSSYGLDSKFYPMAKEIVETITRVVADTNTYEPEKTDKLVVGPF